MVISAVSLSEIALSVGFSDQAHLCRHFRAAFGQSPGNWRREHVNLGRDNPARLRISHERSSRAEGKSSASQKEIGAPTRFWTSDLLRCDLKPVRSIPLTFSLAVRALPHRLMLNSLNKFSLPRQLPSGRRV
jgi:Helix-turn-helix domain